MGLFDNFGPLDDLIQVIYHSTSCFILMSKVENTRWTVELGLVGEGGRWWRGSWSEKDVYSFAGSKITEEALESFAARLAKWIITGELAIGDWSPEKGVEIKLQINPMGKAPVVIPLAELPAEEASVKAMKILKQIALQAQSHQCRINAPAATVTSVPDIKPSQPVISKEDKELQKAQERIKRLEGEVIQAKQAAVDSTPASPSKPVAPKPPRGASRANPARQKRKIVEAEFESD